MTNKLNVAEMIRITLLVILSLVFQLFSSPAFAHKTDATIRLEPHTYSGVRGNEPGNQMLIFGNLNWHKPQEETRYPWQVKLHGDFETLGRKDNSVDIDRAWIQIPVSQEAGPVLTAGRIHPFDISHHPDAKRPWGLLAQSHAQNRSVLLGNPMVEGVFPEPTLQGWVGAHAWSDSSYSKSFQYGFSATPVFIPSMGSQVDYSRPDEFRSGRFGRRPPAYVEMKGKKYPIVYELDTSDLSSEVLQPQLMGQTYARVKHDQLSWESWVAVRRAPSIEPDLETKGVLNISDSKPHVVAKVKPHFRQKWSSSLTQRFTHRKAPLQSAFISSVEIDELGAVGSEWGVDSKLFAVSYLNQYTPMKPSSDFSFKTESYTDHLVQFEGRIPTSFCTLYGGTKHNIYSNSSWLRGGVRSAVTDSLNVDFGVDLFTGDHDTYFGEWRSNDRIYLGINWRLGS